MTERDQRGDKTINTERHRETHINKNHWETEEEAEMVTKGQRETQKWPSIHSISMLCLHMCLCGKKMNWNIIRLSWFLLCKETRMFLLFTTTQALWHGVLCKYKVWGKSGGYQSFRGKVEGNTSDKGRTGKKWKSNLKRRSQCYVNMPAIFMHVLCYSSGSSPTQDCMRSCRDSGLTAKDAWGHFHIFLKRQIWKWRNYGISCKQKATSDYTYC